MYILQQFRLCSLLVLAFTVQAVAGDHPVRSEFECATVRGCVNERPVQLLIDTGAVKCGLDVRVRKALGVKVLSEMTVSAPSGTVSIPVCEPIHLTIDKYPVRSVEPVQLDLQMLTSMGLFGIEGIVGRDALSHHVVVISDGTVSILDSVPPRFEVIQKQTFKRADSNVASLPVFIPTLEGQQVTLEIDTGSTEACRFKESVIASLKANRQIVTGLSQRGSDVKGVVNGTSFILREIIVAGVRFRNVRVTSARNNAIGLELLRHLNLALDFPQRQIVIAKPAKDVVDHFPQNASGMGIRFDAADNLKVLAVRPDGPAEGAGIRIGDIVLMLDSRNPVELSIYEVDDIVAQNGRTIPVRLRRDSAEFTVDLPLKLPFEYPPNWASLDKEQADFEEFLRKQDNDASERPK